MKVFILGLPETGTDSVAQALCQDTQYCYVDGFNWTRQTFRSIRDEEHIEQYHDEYHRYITNRLLNDADLYLRNIIQTIKSNQSNHYVIDGMATPRDFVGLFDYTQDYVVFLNRIDNEDVRIKDYEKIGVSVMRDYCFWLSSAGLLNRSRWLEYNFKMINGDPNRFKEMGSKNSVFIVGSLDKVVCHLTGMLLGK